MKKTSSVILTTASFIAIAMATQSVNAQSVVQETADKASQESKKVRKKVSLLDEIIVTSQKRGQKLQEVGIAITALSGEQLKALGMVDSTDIARIASNIAVSGSYGGQMSQFTIRGVTQNDFNDHVESVIAVYIDDAYVAMQQGQTFAMFDIDRVEALKGPQGTLFGRNATGGLVHYITKRPTEEFEGYIDATYASYNNIRLESAISGPLAEGVRARLSGFYEEFDGYIKNKYPEETFVPAALESNLNSVTIPGGGADLGGVKSNWALRAQVEVDLSDNVGLWVAGFINKSVASTGPYQQIPTVTITDADGTHINTINAAPDETCEAIQQGSCVNGLFDHDANAVRERPGSDFFGFLDPDGSGPITSSDYAFDDANTLETYGATAKFTAQLGNVQFTSVTDYKHFTKDFSLDLEAGPVNQFFWHGISEEDAFTQELRFDGQTEKLNWVGGLYYLRIDNYSVHGIGALPDSAYPIASWDQPRVVNLDTTSYSLFGQVEYKLSDTLTVIGGLRGSREEKEYDFEVLFVFPNPDGNVLGWDFSPAIEFPGFSQGIYEAESKGTLWSWKAQINWQPNDDTLMYFGVTQGAKAGSFNAGGAPLPAEDIPFDAEKLISYEVGLKSTFLDGNVRFNAAAFYYDYSNYQAARWLGFSSLIINSDAYIYGAEADVTAFLTDSLELSVNVGLQKNKVKDVPVAGELRDVHTTFSPEFTIAGTLRYTVPNVIANGDLTFQLDGNYQSKIWHNLNNFDANQLDAYGIVNVRVGWTSEDGDWAVSLFGKNLFNNVYDIVGFDLSQICGCNLQSQGRPRWLGINVKHDF
ncbi:MAG: TonB-dependent receptor [Alphaproteobacteria bacterium]|nr:MAG: TonB-dependent receptor [Alphaproteobacteria bacterium]